MLTLTLHRYSHNDDVLPEWFEEEEHMHRQPARPETKEMVADMRVCNSVSVSVSVYLFSLFLFPPPPSVSVYLFFPPLFVGYLFFSPWLTFFLTPAIFFFHHDYFTHPGYFSRPGFLFFAPRLFFSHPGFYFSHPGFLFFSRCDKKKSTIALLKR